MADDVKVVNLKFPVITTVKKKIQDDLGREVEEDVEVTIDKVKLGRIKTKHLKSIPRTSEPGPADFIPLIAAVAGLPVEAVEEIDLKDLQPIIDILSNALGE